MPGRKRDLIDHSYTAGWVGIRPEMKAKPMFQIDRVYSAGVHFAKEVAAVAAMVCVAFGPGITASAQQESRLSSIQPFSDLIEALRVARQIIDLHLVLLLVEPAPPNEPEAEDPASGEGRRPGLHICVPKCCSRKYRG